jgi:hypothetical protein
MEVAGLQVVPLPPSFPLQIHRSALASVEPSIAPTSINDIKAIEVPWFLASKVILWFHRCQRLLRSLTETTASLTADECNGTNSDWNSMGSLESGGFGERPWFQ